MRTPSFEIEIASVRAGIRLTVRGEIDADSVRRLERARAEVLADPPEWLLIDLRAVGFIDSSGLKFLIETFELSQQGDWSLQLLKPPASAMRVFTITGTDRLLPFSEEAAE